ncbi:MAG: aldo/keto reductase [Candidatus Pelagadaptatus aseana]|uniref:aldo/keto reductase n=1 Tax=Candidatus Pelagadaptatus aseana TaxID=3120508 RepID=UPI0039B130DB
MHTLQLNDGHTIPAQAYGTCAIGGWQQDDQYVVDTILKAIACGYRHFDTASLYGNERSLGKAIQASGIPREEFFIVSKVWDNQQGYEQTLTAFEQSLARLQMEYVDLYLVHWPVPEQTRATWQAMEALHDQGKVRSLGLSNFRQQDIEDLLGFARIKPTYNQLELHPYLTQSALCDFCQDNGIVVACWSPLGSGTWSNTPTSEKPIADPVIAAIADKYQVGPAQVILKWDIQQQRIVLPKAESETNMRKNLELDGFELTEEEIAAINQLNRDHRFGADPDTAYADNMAMTVPA